MTKQSSIFSSKKRETVKYMQVLSVKVYKKLAKIADERGITVQELTRVLIIPDWLIYRELDEQRMKQLPFPPRKLLKYYQKQKEKNFRKNRRNRK